MSPIEPLGGSAFARSAPHHATPAPAARSGAEKAQSMQSPVTGASAAPVETTLAIVQSQATAESDMRSAAPPASQQATTQAAASRVAPAPQPMTAVLLYELRLQQELADVQEQKELTERTGD